MADLENLLSRTIASISQSDPLIKLLDQVKVGRMKPNDPGLRAITESWLTTYRKAIETSGLTKHALRRIDPSPRIALLTECGLLPYDHPALRALRDSFAQAMATAKD